jgi:hypothetical protein
MSTAATARPQITAKIGVSKLLRIFFRVSAVILAYVLITPSLQLLNGTLINADFRRFTQINLEKICENQAESASSAFYFEPATKSANIVL